MLLKIIEKIILLLHIKKCHGSLVCYQKIKRLLIEELLTPKKLIWRPQALKMSSIA